MLIVPRSIHPIELLSAIQSGAIGCILRDSSPDLIIRALHSVTSGLPWIQRELTEHILQGFNTFPISEEPVRALTEREKQILIMLAKGLSNKEIVKTNGLEPSNCENACEPHIAEIEGLQQNGSSPLRFHLAEEQF
ncbi:regulatory protein, luxR family [Candidatus Fervidibacteria bacterium JGI MDM2 SSWTFF-3-K9]